MARTVAQQAYRAVRLVGRGALVALERGDAVNVVRFGVALATGDPVSAVAETISAVGGAVCSYLELRGERERTKQLEHALSAERAALADHLEAMKLAAKASEAELAVRRRAQRCVSTLMRAQAALLEAVRSSLDDLRERAAAEAGAAAEYQRLVHDYEQAAVDFRNLTDQLY